MAAATGSRRLQAATDSVTVKTTIATATPASTMQLLQSAATDGTLATALTPLGLTISSNGVTVSTVSGRGRHGRCSALGLCCTSAHGPS